MTSFQKRYKTRTDSTLQPKFSQTFIMTSILLSVAFLALVGWSGATTPFILDACSGAKPGIPADIAAQRGAALAYGNEYRRRHGAKPLTVDPTVR